MNATGALLRRVATVAALAGLLLAVTPPAAGAADKASPGLAPHVPGTVLVGFRPGVSLADRAAARAAVGAVASSPLSPLAVAAERWSLGGRTSVEAAIAALARNPLVRYAEPDYLLRTAATSDDPYYLGSGGTLWGMHGDAISPNANQFGTGADEAWAGGYVGSSDVYVGVIDEGIQFTHPDLAANVWTNPWDPVDGVDNDGNGYVDDVHGWDFFNNDAGIYDAGADAHGTHVSGTIGGVGGNGIGVAGVNWNVTIISGKFLGPSGGSTSGAVLAVDYLTRLKTLHGINLVATSNSWGGGGASQSLLDAINRGGDAGILFVAAAGNSASNNDATASYPSNYQCTNGGTRGWDCVVAVAAIDAAGNRASFTSFGATTVDIGAPGVGIWSSVPTDAYASYNGTSMATPHVSGAVALCESINPSLTANDLRNAILSSGAPTPSLAGYTATGDRLDVGALVAACSPSVAPPSGLPGSLTATSLGTSQISIAWSDGVTGETSYEVQRATGTVGTCGTWSTVASAPAGATSYLATNLPSATAFCFRVRGANTYAGGSVTAWSNEASAATAAPPPAYVCESAAYAWLDPTSGTAHALTDDSSKTVALPFAFTAYGQTYTSIVIGSNGFARLGTSTAGTTSYTNVAIPSAVDPNAILAPYWDDLNPGVGGQIYTATIGTAPNRSFVVGWINVPAYFVSGSAITFELVLEEGGDVVRYQYQDVTVGSATYDAGASATVGIEGDTGEWGTQISYNTAILTAPSAYRCSATPGTPPTIGAATPPDATTGVAYSTTFSASGGSTPYTWSVASGALPAGLTLGTSTGTVAGNPTAVGTASFTLRATGSDGSSSTRAFSIRVAAPLAISTATLPNASLGVAYSQALASTGGQSPITWTLKAGSGLPAGLVLSSAGTISGTPTAGGTTSFTVVATDGGSPSVRTAEKALSITVVAPPTIATGALPDGTTGIGYSSTLVASGGATPYAWSLAAGSLPAGLTLSGAGVITGTPSAVGTAAFTVRVTGSDGGTSTWATSIRVAAPIAISTTTLANASLSQPYAVTLGSTGGQSPITWSVTAGSLPAGLTLSSGGVISGTPTVSGTASFTVRATDAGSPTQRTASQALSLTVVPPPAVTASVLNDGTIGAAYSVTLAATGGAAPYTWSLASGSLPAGLTLSSAGVISGNPTTAGTSSFTVKVTGTDSGASTWSTAILVAAPLAVSTTSLATPVLGTAYAQTVASSGGTGPFGWSISSGSLPPGLSLAGATGAISGTPTTAGSFSFTVRVQDAGNPTRTATRAYTLAIAFAKSNPVAGTALASGVLTPTLAWFAHGGATSYRWCVTTSSKGCTTTWTGSTTALSAVTATLSRGKTYYWQVQALVNGTWVSANAGTYWRFTTAR